MANADEQPSHSKAAKRKRQLARRFTPGILQEHAIRGQTKKRSEVKA